MRLTMRRMRVTLSAAIVLAVFMLSDSPARAQVTKPFRISGSGSGPYGLPLPGQPPRLHWAIGSATGLGTYYGVGTEQTLSVNLPPLPHAVLTGTFQSGTPFQFFGSNGDILACDYGHPPEVGRVFLVPVGNLHFIAYFIADFIPRTNLCTGKFAGVTGGWTMYAVSEPFVPGVRAPLYYSWQGEGSLTFPSGQ